MARLFIGTSGYSYRHWRGVLYPTGLPSGAWLRHYSEHFSSVELNGTFYGLPTPATVERWLADVPDDFVFAAKMSRYGTHLKRLKDPDGWVARFLDAVEPLGPRLGPILVQLPPRWHRDIERLAAFLERIPHHHRWTMEFRDADWLHPSVYGLLREHGVALCVHDRLPNHPRLVTAGWVYLRFHGPDLARPYAGRYSTQALVGTARRIHDHLDAGRDVYVYFDNDIAGAAVHDAVDLARYAGSTGGAGVPG